MGICRPGPPGPRRTVASIAFRAAQGFFALVAPPGCASCGEALGSAAVDDLCPVCEEAFPRFPALACAGCGGVTSAGSVDYCSRCAPLFCRDTLVALAPFEGSLRGMIHAFKYGGDLGAGRCLARRLAKKVDAELAGRCDVIVPVPLHPGRLRARGFNQAVVLGRGISRRSGWPLRAVALRRRVDTASLAGLGLRERKREMRGAMVVRRAGAVAGKRVLLVDDVCTTGVTAEECCRVLRLSGAREVHVAVAGRA